MNIYIDIETIPSQLEWVKQDIRASITAPGNYKKPESIEKWMDENLESSTDEQWLKTALNGSVGEIICISYAIDDGPIKTIGRELEGNEGDLLLDFITDVMAQTAAPTWVGHYITGFDLRYIWQRMAINGVEGKSFIPHSSKPWDSNIFDTSVEWSGIKSQGYGSLDTLCKIFGIKGKGDIDGSKVWDYVKDGRYQEVFDYCADDVERVRQLYKVMK